MRRTIAELPAADVAVFNGNNGVLHIIAFQIVYDDLAVGTELGSEAVGQAGVKINGVFIHGSLLSDSE